MPELSRMRKESREQGRKPEIGMPESAVPSGFTRQEPSAWNRLFQAVKSARSQNFWDFYFLGQTRNLILSIS